ncbi:MAG: hypothetical protein ACJA1C_000871 [Crocinitomicaceae bacterium]
MKLFKKKIKVHNENWRIWDFFDEDDLHGLITYDVTYLDPATRNGYTNEVILDLTVPEQWLGEGNFPTPDGHSALIDVEDELITKLEKNRVNCMQVIRQTYNGARTFIFEVEDLVKFLETVKSWIPTASVFEIKIEKESSWVNYEGMKPNEYNWQQIGNQQVIEQLESNGSDLEKMHKLEFSFGGDLSNLEKLKTILMAEEAKLLLLEGDLLEVEFECLLDNSEIDPLSHFLLDAAKEHSCKYEGWRAAIVK